MSVIGRADSIFPDSAPIFRSPIWAILEGRAVPEAEIGQELVNLGPIVEGLFLMPPAKFGAADHFLLKDFTERELSTIADHVTFKTFQAAIMMIGYFSQLQHIDFRNAFSDVYRKMIPNLIEGQCVPYYHRFFDFVDGIAYRLELGLFSKLERRVISWRELYPELAAQPEQQPERQERRKPVRRGVLR
jgi:hypothetical protein